MPEWMELARFGLTLFVMLVGLFGLLIPVFPGTEIIWLTALVYGLVSGFGGLGGWIFAILTVLAIAAAVADNVLINAGAVRGGASWGSMLAGVAAGIVGTIVFPPFGGLVGAPLAVLLLESYRRSRSGDPHPWEGAWRALRGIAAGWVMAFLVRFGLGLLMILLWVVWDWQG
jgi:uncharacterized protein YqgC (DUF456 family)